MLHFLVKSASQHFCICIWCVNVGNCLLCALTFFSLTVFFLHIFEFLSLYFIFLSFILCIAKWCIVFLLIIVSYNPIVSCCCKCVHFLRKQIFPCMYSSIRRGCLIHVYSLVSKFSYLLILMPLQKNLFTWHCWLFLCFHAELVQIWRTAMQNLLTGFLGFVIWYIFSVNTLCNVTDIKIIFYFSSGTNLK